MRALGGGVNLERAVALVGVWQLLTTGRENFLALALAGVVSLAQRGTGKPIRPRRIELTRRRAHEAFSGALVVIHSAAA